MPVVLDIKNVSVLRDEKPILSNINWQVEEDQRWVIIGPNGAGKTTLLRLAASQIHPSTGEVTVLGEQLGSTNVFDIRTRVGFASSALASHIPNTETVLNAVMTAAYAVTGRWFENYDSMDERRALRVLGEWRLGELADRKFGTLSDGERKRVQLARAVMTDPELLLLDEPVASLDLAARETTIQILGEYAKAPAAPAMVIVTHHLEEIPAGITHALLLSEGKIFAAGKIHETITSDKISEAFGVSIQVSLDYGRYRARAV
jgi:iron complex transport system ATP-binding protein